MNAFLLILQVLLAAHTAMGAVWKLSHSAEQTMPSLKAIPDPAWLGMAGLELLCALALVIPAVYRPLRLLVPIAASFVALEMLTYTGLHLFSGDGSLGPVIYWITVALICGFIAFKRLASDPGQSSTSQAATRKELSL